MVSAYMTPKWSKLQILNEGLAIYLSTDQSFLNNKIKAIYLNSNIVIQSIFNDNLFLSNTLVNYVIGGVFVKFLLNNYSLENFKEAWNETAHEDNERNIIEFERVYHKSIEELEIEFFKYLD